VESVQRAGHALLDLYVREDEGRERENRVSLSCLKTARPLPFYLFCPSTFQARMSCHACPIFSL